MPLICIMLLLLTAPLLTAQERGGYVRLWRSGFRAVLCDARDGEGGLGGGGGEVVPGDGGSSIKNLHR